MVGAEVRLDTGKAKAHIFIIGLVLMASLTAIGCSRAKASAETAIKAGEEQLNAVRPAAAMSAPDELAAVEASLQNAKDRFKQGEYESALATAQLLPSMILDLKEEVTRHENSAVMEWNNLQRLKEQLPMMIDVILRRIDLLSKPARFPANVDKAKYGEARSSVATFMRDWTEASAAFDAGNYVKAVAKAHSVKDKATEIMAWLGDLLPAVAKKDIVGTWVNDSGGSFQRFDLNGQRAYQDSLFRFAAPWDTEGKNFLITKEFVYAPNENDLETPTTMYRVEIADSTLVLTDESARGRALGNVLRYRRTAPGAFTWRPSMAIEFIVINPEKLK